MGGMLLFVILNRGKNIKYRPYAFTKQGVAMLSPASFGAIVRFGSILR